MADEDVLVQFGARISGLLAGLTQAQGAVEKSVGGMQAALDKLAGGFTTVLHALELVIATAAGGGAFKKIIDDTNALGSEAYRTANYLGTTSEQASVMKVALDSVGLSTQEYTGTLGMFQRNLRMNEGAMQAMGLRTRDAAGNFRPLNDLFQDGLKIISQYAAGTDRNQASMALFGRRVGDVNQYLRLTKQAQEEAKKEAEALNLVVSQQSIEGWKQYQSALAGANNVLLGVENTIGEAVRPAFTALLNSFRSLGPGIIQVTRVVVDFFGSLKDSVGGILSELWSVVKTAFSGIGMIIKLVLGESATAMNLFAVPLRTVMVAFIGLREIVEEVMNVITTVLTMVAQRAAAFAASVNLAFHLDFKGAAAAWKMGADDATETLRKGLAKAVDIATKAGKDIKDALTKPMGVKPSTPPEADPSKGKGFVDPNKAAALAQAQAAVEKAQADAAAALARERLKEAEDGLKESYSRRLVTIQEYYAEELNITLATIDAELKAKKAALAEQEKAERKQTDPAKKLQEHAKTVALIGQIQVLEQQRSDAYVKNTNQEIDAETKLRNALKETALTLQEDLGNKRIAQEQANDKQMYALRQISEAQLLDLQKQRAAESLDVAQKKIDGELAMENLSDEKRAELMAKRVEAEQAYADQIRTIDQQLELDRQKYSLEAQQTIENSMTSFLTNLANGTTSLRKLWTSLITDITAAINKMMAEKLVQQFFGAGSSGGSWIGSLLGMVGGGSGMAPGPEIGGAQLGATSFGFGGGFADGGDISKNTAYLVGERGPELFVPSSGGSIVPNGKFGGSVTVHNNFNVSGPIDTRTQDQIATLTGVAVQRALKRGGRQV